MSGTWRTRIILDIKICKLHVHHMATRSAPVLGGFRGSPMELHRPGVGALTLMANRLRSIHCSLIVGNLPGEALSATLARC
jgi:hypothetical protein